MEIWSKVKKKTSAAVSKTKGMAEIVKLKSEINSERDIIEEAETAIGIKYYAEKGSSPDPGFESYCADIDSAYARIAEIKAQIRVIKGVINCPGCGNEVIIEMNYCPVCGIKIEHPEEPNKSGEEAEDKKEE